VFFFRILFWRGCYSPAVLVRCATVCRYLWYPKETFYQKNIFECVRRVFLVSYHKPNALILQYLCYCDIYICTLFMCRYFEKTKLLHIAMTERHVLLYEISVYMRYQSIWDISLYELSVYMRYQSIWDISLYEISVYMRYQVFTAIIIEVSDPGGLRYKA
jgi:hypothetical protein